MTDTPQINSGLTHYLAWFKAHEKFLIILTGAILVFHFYGSVLNVWTDHDKRKIAADTQIAQAAQQKTQADSQENTQLLQQLADLKLQQATLSAQLQVSMQKRAQQTDDQKKKNNVSTSSEVAVRTASILRVQPQDITSNSDSTLTFSPTSAHANVNALEDGAQAQADVLDLNKKVAVCVAVTAKQDETITGVRKELSDEKISHSADVKLEQANTKLAVDEGKKKFRSGFKWGVVTGIGISIAAKIGHVIGF
jgi:hypothetical protein